MSRRLGPADRIRSYYNVPAKRGMHILVAKKVAKITGFDRSQMYLLIRYPGEPILGLRRAHPTWSVTYPCSECGQLASHEITCSQSYGKKHHRRSPSDIIDDPVSRGRAEDNYLNQLIGEA